MSALRKAWAIAKKDMRVYYLRGPVIIFGIFFPTCLFAAFVLGRSIPPQQLVPGLIGMALFFTASATTPAVLPFETRTRTLERLLAAPVSIPMLVAGDCIAAFLFGVVLSAIPLAIALLIAGAHITRPAMLALAVVLSAACFAILGSLFSTPPTDNPSSVMTISNLVRLPLIFFSGVFIPVAQLSGWSRAVAAISPLTYTTELLRTAFGQPAVFQPLVCVAALVGFIIVLWVVTIALHERNMLRRLWLS